MNIESKIRNIKPNISTSTLRSYVNNLKKLFKEIDENEDVLNDVDVIKEYINNKKSYLTKRNYLNSIIVFLQSDKEKNIKLIDEYQQLRDEYNNKYKESNKDNMKSDKQIKNWITIKQIEEIKLHLEQDLKNEENRIHHFMLSFWLDYPIRNDLQNTTIINKKKYDKLLKEELDKQNYLVLHHEPFISISQYKTFKKYGIKKILLNKNIQDILKKYLVHNPTKYILYNIRDKSPMSSEDITINFNKLFKKYYPEKQISTTMLRHIILSERYGDVLDEMKVLADIMGHDITTAHSIYIKK
tara:strand:- start:743 stop:1639 length:897 start_codon:yes stop_codon:yes gene_type:complete